MDQILYILATSFIITLVTTPAVKWIAVKIGAIDVPKSKRRIHTKPIPRMGGLAIFIGFLAAVLIFVPHQRELVGLLSGAIILIIMGIIDDMKELPAKVKIVGQILAAVVAYSFGIRIDWITNPWGGMLHVREISFIITIFWIVGITNTINFIDGLDGLASGVSAIIAMAMAILAFNGNNMFVTMIMMAVLGSTLGFLPYNFNPARIFMGDTGALFLGYILAVASVMGAFKNATTLVTFAVLAIGLPIFDTTFAIIRRFLNKQPIMSADRGHMHHRLLDMGFNQKQAVGILYLISGSFCFLAVGMDFISDQIAIIFMITTGIVIGLLMIVMLIGIHKTKSEPEEDQNRFKIMTIFGTRPEAIKMAPVIKALEKEEKVHSYVCVTGQHREMLMDVLEGFEIHADENLDIMKDRQTLTYITTEAIGGLSDAMERVKPNLVLVHGDTTTTFAGALAAFYHRIPVGHVEAGLRTGDKYSPYPEEVNRKLTGTLADFHFAPTEEARQNLLQEGVDPGTIYVTGNTVIDAVLMNLKEDYTFKSEEVAKFYPMQSKMILMTSHRRENVGEKMESYFRGILAFIEEREDTELIYPVHKNPVIVEIAQRILGHHPRIHLVEPIETEDFHNLMKGAYMIVTDSGGIQEEASALKIPVLVLRDTTERPEAIEAGIARLVGTTKESVYEGMKAIYDSKEQYDKMVSAKNPFGDGTSAIKIIKIIQDAFGIDGYDEEGRKTERDLL